MGSACASPQCLDLGVTVQKWDETRSTEDNYCIHLFEGANADVRPLLDYSWHKMYVASRVSVQDSLIEQLVSRPSISEQPILPWVVFTAGAMGAGKGYVVKWMSERGYLPMEQFVVVDPDQIRQLLPEWETYVRKDSELAGNMTQKEAGMIAEILGYRALRDRHNVIFDGSLRDAGWYSKYFHQLRVNFPGIRIMILHIVADKDEVLRRAEERGKKTGRVVPPEVLLGSMEAVPRSVGILSQLTDFTCRVRNSGPEPRLEREPGAPYPSKSVPLSWELIKSLWQPLDLDGDGEMSKEEVDRAIALGILTHEVVATIDKDGSGSISKAEVLQAQEAAKKATSLVGARVVVVPS